MLAKNTRDEGKFNVEKISVMKPDLSNVIRCKSSFSQSLEAGETGCRFLVLEGKPLCAHCQHVFWDLKKDTRRNLTHPRNYSPGTREAALLSRETKTPLADKLQLLPAHSVLRRPGKSCPWEAWRAATIQKRRSQQARWAWLLILYSKNYTKEESIPSFIQ